MYNIYSCINNYEHKDEIDKIDDISYNNYN